MLTTQIYRFRPMYDNTFLNIPVSNLYIQDKLKENGVRL